MTTTTPPAKSSGHHAVGKLFDDWARQGRDQGMERGHEPAARAAFDALNLPPSGRYLDIGCGNGYSVRWAAQVMPEGLAVGIDLSTEMIHRARSRSASYKHARFVQGAFPHNALRDPGLLGDGFDAILSVEAFYYLPDLDAALGEVKDLLRDGGRFACIVDYYTENVASHCWAGDLNLELRLLSEEGWREAFEEAGLAVLQQKRVRVPGGEAWKQEQGSLLTVGQAQ